MLEEGARNDQRAIHQVRRRHQSSPEELKCGADVGRLLASGRMLAFPTDSGQWPMSIR